MVFSQFETFTRNKIKSLKSKLFKSKYIPSLSSSNKIELQQGITNADKAAASSKDLWPNWLIRQSDITQESFNISQLSNCNNNITEKNWTQLSTPGCKTKSIIDPKGVLYISPHQGSIDHLLVINDTCEYASNLQAFDQYIAEQSAKIITIFKIDSCIIRQETCFKENEDGIPISHQNIRIENKSNQSNKISCFVSIKPYYINGFTSLKNINVLSNHCVLVNHQPTLLFNQKPQNVICFANEDGSFKEQFDQFDLLYHSKCSDHLCSAYIQFSQELPANTELSFSYQVFHQENKSFLSQNNPSLNRFIKKQRNSYHTNIQSLVSEWETINKGIGSVNLTDNKQTQQFSGHIFHLINQLGSYHKTSDAANYQNIHPELISNILALNRYNGLNLSKKLIAKLIQKLNKYPLTNFSSNLIDWNQTLFICYDFFKYSNDNHFFVKHERLILQYYKLIQKSSCIKYMQNNPISTLFKKQISRDKISIDSSILTNLIWTFHGLRSANRICKSLKYNYVLGASLEKNIFEYIQGILNGIFESPLKQISTQSYQKPPELNLVQPFCEALLNQYQARKLLDHILRKNYMGIYIHQSSVVGINPSQNIDIAQASIQFEQYDIAKTTLNYLLRIKSNTDTWPELIDPKTEKGVHGLGHLVECNSKILLLIHQTLIQESEHKLILCPHIFELFTDLEKLSFDLSCRFGNIQFMFQKLDDNQYQVNLKHHFYRAPREFEFHFSTPIDRIKWQNNTETKIQNQVANISLNDDAFTFWT